MQVQNAPLTYYQQGDILDQDISSWANEPFYVLWRQFVSMQAHTTWRSRRLDWKPQEATLRSAPNQDQIQSPGPAAKRSCCHFRILLSWGSIYSPQWARAEEVRLCQRPHWRRFPGRSQTWGKWLNYWKVGLKNSETRRCNYWEQLDIKTKHDFTQRLRQHRQQRRLRWQELGYPASSNHFQ